MPPRVLFVSKPIAPPFNDGTKCLVRDIALHLRRHRAQVMALRGGTDLGCSPCEASPGVTTAEVYRTRGSFTPTLADNARAAAWLVLRSRADLWHFAFAPNARTSAAGRVAKALRRVPVVQTVASAPRSFAPDLFFGDVVVAQSAWTRDRILAAFRSASRSAPRIEVVPPPVGPLRTPSSAAVGAVRRALALPDGAPVFVYPGDLEVSHGAKMVASAVASLVRAVPGVVVVFACRAKSAAAPGLEAALRDRLDPRHTRFAREVDLLALLTVAAAVLFPVDDLSGKVDLPISLLEAMRLGVPVVVERSGPLLELEGAVQVPSRDVDALVAAAVLLVRDHTHRAGVISTAAEAVTRRYDAPVVAAAYERLYDELLTARGHG